MIKQDGNRNEKVKLIIRFETALRVKKKEWFGYYRKMVNMSRKERTWPKLIPIVKAN